MFVGIRSAPRHRTLAAKQMPSRARAHSSSTPRLIPRGDALCLRYSAFIRIGSTGPARILAGPDVCPADFCYAAGWFLLFYSNGVCEPRDTGELFARQVIAIGILAPQVVI